MFERTLEAQALDAPAARLSPFSIALLIHAAVAMTLLALSLMFVPGVIEPDIRPTLGVVFVAEPTEFEPAPPEPVAPEPPRAGSEEPGRAAPAVPEVPAPDAPPSATPEDLPPAVMEPPGDEGSGRGTEGIPGGPEDGGSSGLGGGDGGSGGAGTGSGPVDLSDGMVAPVLLRKVSPAYPAAARIARVEGRVIVEAVIGLDGSVESVEILGSTNPLFDDAAASAVRQWRYRPALMDGRPVRVYFKVEVGFVLR